MKAIPSNSSLQIKAAASQNENSRHATHLGTDIGEPDLRISATVRGTYYILYLELKKKKGTLRDSQIEWGERFDAHFACHNAERYVAYGYEDAKNAIDSWIKKLDTINREGECNESK